MVHAEGPVNERVSLVSVQITCNSIAQFEFEQTCHKAYLSQIRPRPRQNVTVNINLHRNYIVSNRMTSADLYAWWASVMIFFKSINSCVSDDNSLIIVSLCKSRLASEMKSSNQSPTHIELCIEGWYFKHRRVPIRTYARFKFAPSKRNQCVLQRDSEARISQQYRPLQVH